MFTFFELTTTLTVYGFLNENCPIHIIVKAYYNLPFVSLACVCMRGNVNRYKLLILCNNYNKNGIYRV